MVQLSNMPGLSCLRPANRLWQAVRGGLTRASLPRSPTLAYMRQHRQVGRSGVQEWWDWLVPAPLRSEQRAVLCSHAVKLSQ